MEKKMETIGILGVILGVYWGYIGRMEKKVETAIKGSISAGLDFRWHLVGVLKASNPANIKHSVYARTTIGSI